METLFLTDTSMSLSLLCCSCYLFYAMNNNIRQLYDEEDEGNK